MPTATLELRRPLDPSTALRTRGDGRVLSRAVELRVEADAETRVHLSGGRFREELAEGEGEEDAPPMPWLEGVSVLTAGELDGRRVYVEVDGELFWLELAASGDTVDDVVARGGEAADGLDVTFQHVMGIIEDKTSRLLAKLLNFRRDGDGDGSRARADLHFHPLGREVLIYGRPVDVVARMMKLAAGSPGSPPSPSSVALSIEVDDGHVELSEEDADLLARIVAGEEPSNRAEEARAILRVDRMTTAAMVGRGAANDGLFGVIEEKALPVIDIELDIEKLAEGGDGILLRVDGQPARLGDATEARLAELREDLLGKREELAALRAAQVEEVARTSAAREELAAVREELAALRLELGGIRERAAAEFNREVKDAIALSGDPVTYRPMLEHIEGLLGRGDLDGARTFYAPLKPILERAADVIGARRSRDGSLSGDDQAARAYQEGREAAKRTK